MKTSVILSAVLASIESTHRLIEGLVQDAERSENQEKADAVRSALTELMGSFGRRPRSEDSTSGSAKADQVDAPSSAEPTTTAATTTEKTPVDIAIELLSDERYTLRTVKSVLEKTGFEDQDALEDALDEADVDYVIKSRRRDRAALVGLASRN